MEFDGACLLNDGRVFQAQAQAAATRNAQSPSYWQRVAGMRSVTACTVV